MIKIRRAIISVSDKSGIVELAKSLEKYGVEILSTGGTSKTLKEAGVKVQDISDFTGFPEILDGRVKTLHPKIYGGILAVREKPEHTRHMEENSLVPIDLIVCNLYPFEETLKKGASDEEIIENIDIGGPTMIRAASKNYKNVCVLVNKDLYVQFQSEMSKNEGSVSEEFSFSCAREVFRHTARYDYMISSYFSKRIKKETMPEELDIRLSRVQTLRYGENPHQEAAWYRFCGEEPFPRQQIQGKELSFNNLLDMEAAYTLASRLPSPGCAIIKHTNPCGAATRATLMEAYLKALETDDTSAFGGIAGFNAKVEADIAERMVDRFYEVIIAPDFSPEALEIFKKKKNLRIIKSPSVIKQKYDFRTLCDGMLLQKPDEPEFSKLTVVTSKTPSEKEIEALKFGWLICKYVKSNAIVLASENRTIGIGAGQMSRIDSTRLAVMKMKDNFKEAVTPLVMASDAFFPFPDSVEVAHKSGVTAVIQPGGSEKDEDVVEVCNKLGISMVMTGMRHFRH